MEEIKIGEYVRTKDGIIAQFTRTTTYYKDKIYWFDNTIYQDYEEVISYLSDNNLEKYIKSHSFNIIDLIEKNDFVNGYRILEIYEPLAPDDERILDIGYDMAIFNDSVKSIVTKEMFSSMEYKVGG